MREIGVDENNIRVFPPKAGKKAIPYDEIEDSGKGLIQYIKAIINPIKLNQKLRRETNLLFTRKNIRIDKELDFDGNGIHAYIEVWFDPEKKFGIKLRGDDTINVYAYLTAFKSDVTLSYIIHRSDGRVETEQVYDGLTEDEKTLIREMVNEVSMKETGKNVDLNWFSVFCDIYT